MNKRILIVDDNLLIRSLVRTSLESRPDLEVCGEASDGMEGVEKDLALRPDLIILDFSMPGINGLQAALMLQAISPDTPIILFTMYKDAILAGLASNAGVSSVISKTEPLTVLADEVQRLTCSPN